MGWRRGSRISRTQRPTALGVRSAAGWLRSVGALARRWREPQTNGVAMLSRFWVATVLGVLIPVALTGPARAQAPASSFPVNFEKYLAGEVRPSAAERMTLLSGAPVIKMLP